MTDIKFVTEPLLLLNSDALFSGAGTGPGPVTTDLAEAMQLANEQSLPPQYQIWADVQSRAEAAFYVMPERKEADAILDPIVEAFEAAAKPVRLELRKKKIRKTQTPFDAFVGTVIGDVSMQLQSIGRARYCLGPTGHPLFESMWKSFEAGLYPCGWHNDAGLVSFDPKSLEGHETNPFA